MKKKPPKKPSGKVSIAYCCHIYENGNIRVEGTFRHAGSARELAKWLLQWSDWAEYERKKK